MKAQLTLTLVFIILVSSGSVGATSRDSQTGAVTQPPVVVPFARKPFTKLFRPAPLPTESRSSMQQPRSPARPKVVCGMTLIPGDPAIDSGIATRAQRSETRFTIRAIQPRICWPE
jgi:hypothetical protein